MGLKKLFFRPSFAYAFCLASAGLGVVLLGWGIARLGWNHGNSAYYRRALLFNLLVIGLLVFLRKKLRPPLDRALEWVHRPDHARERKTLYALSLFFFLTYTAKIHWGFWWQGIPGWTMNAPVPLKPTDLDPSAPPRFESGHFLWSAIQKEMPLHYLPQKPSRIEGRAMFLHYRSGEVLPVNYGIFGIVFPNYIFGTEFQYLLDEARFGKMMRAALERQKTLGQRFLLPRWLGYPAHAAYTDLPYENYPDPQLLDRISCWHLALAVFPDRTLRIEEAAEKFFVDVSPEAK